LLCERAQVDVGRNPPAALLDCDLAAVCQARLPMAKSQRPQPSVLLGRQVVLFDASESHAAYPFGGVDLASSRVFPMTERSSMAACASDALSRGKVCPISGLMRPAAASDSARSVSRFE
jgi:hypothetical protein